MQPIAAPMQILSPSCDAHAPILFYALIHPQERSSGAPTKASKVEPGPGEGRRQAKQQRGCPHLHTSGAAFSDWQDVALTQPLDVEVRGDPFGGRV